MELIKIQEDIESQLKKSKINFKKSPKERITKQSVETRIQTIESKWKEFTKNHYEIIKRKDTEDSRYFKEDFYSETEEFYLEFKAELKEISDNLCQSTRPTKQDENCTENQIVKLPKISIPTFSGLYTEWMSFRDLFLSLIHNNKCLDNVQKLHYLKGHLTGEAEQLLVHIPITNDNYQQCWTLLESRYDNKQYLANCILKRFFNHRPIQTESASAIKHLLDSTTNMLHALLNLGIDTTSWDIIVIHIVSMKLDQESRKQWECKVSELTTHSNNLPTFEQFKEFLENRFHSLEFYDPKKFNYKVKSYENSNTKSSNLGQSYHVSQTECSFCKGDHKISNCKEFIKLQSTNKRNFVQENRLCFNCLGNNHSAKHCRSTTSCQVCKRRHHSLLHSSCAPQLTVNKETADRSTTLPSEGTAAAYQVLVEPQGQLEPKSSYVSNGSGQYSLLPTALVDVGSEGSIHQLRALIDPASHLSFITEAAAQLLRLKRKAISENLSGLGGEPNLVSRSKAEVTLRSSYNSNCTVLVEVYILEKLTGFLPPRKVLVEQWPILDSIKLADPEFYLPNKIDILLGSEVYGHLLKEGVKKCPSGSLLAQDTIFGWILTGRNNLVRPTGNMVSMHVRADDMLKSFWEIEDEPKLSKRMMTEEEQRCEEIFAATTKRDGSGRYIVRLPFRQDTPTCIKSQSRDIALKRFIILERRLERDPHLKQEYKRTFDEYLELNHMQQIDKKDNKTGVYLPYHAVVREDKSTTKVRIVFDASCKGTNGKSLNDDLMVGPTLQSDLRHIIMRWRNYSICFTADIVKMYRQILVHEEDSNFQRILWRDDPTKDIQEYKLLRVTFGTSSAPYLAVKALMQLATDEGSKYPLAAERVKKDFYMDDFMSGCENEQEAKEICNQMNNLLREGGFTLQKWYSNNKNVSAMMKLEERIDDKAEKKKLEENLETINKILGLTWNRRRDEFEYAVQLPPMSTPVTKRKIISDISRLYDPLGWIAPSIITAKIFIQKLWLSGLGWDENITQALLDEWVTYRKDLAQLTNFRLSRWMMRSVDDKIVELHGFCDASNAAFGAVVYMRVVSATGEVKVSLVTAKTRVAPIKQVSIPRLELCGAVLVTKLLTEVSEVLDVPKCHLHAWTDSQVVLAWISSHPSKWKTFIANRVAEIISVLDRSQWSHVQSQNNPADCASRGVKPSEISSHHLWLNGPEWLKNKAIDYGKPTNTNTHLEERTASTFAATTNDEGDEVWWKFSSLTKLLRVLAYCRRFLKIKNKKKENLTYLLKKEIEEALDIIIKKSQRQGFLEEINNIIRNK